MNKPLLLSLAAATLLGTNLNAESMYDRIQAMELEMNKMKQELTTLKAEKAASAEDEEESETTADDDEESETTADDDEESEDEDKEGEDTDSEEEGDEEEDEEMDVEEEIRDIQETLTDLNKATSGNKLKFGVDYRFAVENLNYEMADGSEAKNDAFMTNRFWMNMSWAATKNLSFKGQLAYNKAFGQRSGTETAAYETFDWIANENAYDDVIRLRSAYFLYKDSEFLGADIPWTFSVGRRPSTNGHLINLRDDDQEASPMGHTINVEFDGLSAKFGLENLTGADGMYAKLCAGRGMSNAQPMFSSNGTPYATDDNTNPDIDLIGLIFVPYDNGHYSVNTQYYYASNLIDMTMASPTDTSFTTVGGLHSFTANLTMNGIGDEWSDFLDDSIFFVSGAVSISDPDSDQQMFDTTVAAGESATGYSGWVGLQVPSLISEDGRWGVEYNYGTEFWRSMTYGEDTNIGSKMATRGHAYEAYFTEYLVEDILSLQIRYTYIDYEYTGSNGFFGATTGESMKIEENMANASMYVDKAQDIRFYLRYKY